MDEAIHGLALGLLAALVVPLGEFDMMPQTEMRKELPLEHTLTFQGLIRSTHLLLHPAFLYYVFPTSPR